MVFSSQLLQLCSLICSLPHLEDLHIRVCGWANLDGGDDTALHPLALPPLTGTLNICQSQEIEHFIHRLSDVAKGVRFRKLECSWDFKVDVQCTMTAVDVCSDTLEHVEISSEIHGMLDSFRLCCYWYPAQTCV